jgi:hypothetical protein
VATAAIWKFCFDEYPLLEHRPRSSSLAALQIYHQAVYCLLEHLFNNQKKAMSLLAPLGTDYPTVKLVKIHLLLTSWKMLYFSIFFFTKVVPK